MEKKRKKRKTLPARLRHSAWQALPPKHSPLAQDTKQARRHESSRTQASAGREIPCPSSQPQDLRVERGEGGPLPQVTWRYFTWSIAKPCPPVLAPGPGPPEEAVQSGNPEGRVHELPAAGRSQDEPTPCSLPPRRRWSPFPGAHLVCGQVLNPGRGGKPLVIM